MYLLVFPMEFQSDLVHGIYVELFHGIHVDLFHGTQGGYASIPYGMVLESIWN